MEIKKVAMCGTLDSRDVLVTVRPSDEESISISSPVASRYEEEMKNVVKKVLNDMDCHHVSVTLQDSGALDCVIEARVLTALQRGMENE